MGMYAALEDGGTAEVNRGVQAWLNGPQTFQRADNPGPRQRRVLTIVHVHEPGEPEDHVRRVREWAQSAWDAWRGYHHVAKQWIEEATARLREPADQRSHLSGAAATLGRLASGPCGRRK